MRSARDSATSATRRALPALVAWRADGAVVFPDALTNAHRADLAAFFLKNRIPSAAGWAPFADSGFLVSYGPNLLDAYKRAAYFVDRIIKGAKPADLPIEMPAAIEMVVNRRTASALSLPLPSVVALRANRVID
jgi:putative tryptophan/tyrosine transport system substrate-binding protein